MIRISKEKKGNQLPKPFPFPQLPTPTSDSPTTRRSYLRRHISDLFSKICLSASSLAAWTRVKLELAVVVRPHFFLVWWWFQHEVKISSRISLICNAVSFNSWIYFLISLRFSSTSSSTARRAMKVFWKTCPRSLRIVFLASSRCFSSCARWFFRPVWSSSVWSFLDL